MSYGVREGIFSVYKITEVNRLEILKIIKTFRGEYIKLWIMKGTVGYGLHI